MLHTSARVRLMEGASGLRGDEVGVTQASGVDPTNPTLLSLRVGELLGGTTGRAGPIRRNDSVSANDNVLVLVVSVLEVKEILDVTCIILWVSSSTECMVIHWCFNASDASVLFSGSGWIILEIRSCADGDIFNSEGNSSDPEQ